MGGLIRIDWPEYGAPAVPAEPDIAEYSLRLSTFRAALARRGHDIGIVYGDREHSANLHWLTGFDPRFEEAVLVVALDRALLLAGNECLPYTQTAPLVASGVIAVGHAASLSLPSQPRDSRRLPDWLAEAVPRGANVGMVGWKWFGADEVDDPATALDVPAFVADPVRAVAGSVENATDLLMHPAHGLRARVDAGEIARLEFANHMAAAALRRMAHAFRPGMTDFEAVAAGHVGGLPLGCHMTFATGARADQGLSSASGQVLKLGTPISFNVCHWRANICRAGWLAHDTGDLPAMAKGYVDDFVMPYLQAMSDWCALMRPGVPGGAVWDAMQEALPFATYGVTLNPGHLIGLDEWMSSPISDGSDIPLASGMAMQMDVIPGHPAWGSTRMEDGYALADAALRADLAARFPDVAARCGARAAFMRKVIGMQVPDTLLPLADTCGIISPYLFAPSMVAAL